MLQLENIYYHIIYVKSLYAILDYNIFMLLFQIPDPEFEGRMVYDTWIANNGGATVRINLWFCSLIFLRY